MFWTVSYLKIWNLKVLWLHAAVRGLKKTGLAKSIDSITGSCNFTGKFCDSVISMSSSETWNAL